MKTVLLRVTLSGTRDSVNWPRYGAAVRLPDSEADALLRRRDAVVPDATPPCTVYDMVDLAAQRQRGVPLEDGL